MDFSAAKRNAFWRLMRADKPIGTYLLLWPTWWALLLAAQGLPGWHLALVFSLGVFVMRSAGCVINDFADRKVDGAVKRTAARPIVSGEVTEKEALGLFAFLVLVAFALVITLNWQTVVLSVGGLILAASYPFMKRYTHLPQVVLGAAFSWGMPMAFMAVNTHIPPWAWVLYLVNLLWTVAYDTEYAMVDRDDDIVIGVKSTAILFGQFDRLAIGLLQLTTLILLVWLTTYLQMAWSMYAAIAVTAVLFVYQHWLIRNRERDACFSAFLHNHYVGMVLTAGIAGHFLLLT